MLRAAVTEVGKDGAALESLVDGVRVRPEDLNIMNAAWKLARDERRGPAPDIHAHFLL